MVIAAVVRISQRTAEGELATWGMGVCIGPIIVCVYSMPDVNRP